MTCATETGSDAAVPLLRLAEALALAGQMERSAATCLEAAHAAERAGRVDLLAAAALVVQGVAGATSCLRPSWMRSSAVPRLCGTLPGCSSSASPRTRPPTSCSAGTRSRSLIGMLLDQQFPMERAFGAPRLLADRLGVATLSAAELAAADPEELVRVFQGPPALHRYPGSMAGADPGASAGCWSSATTVGPRTSGPTLRTAPRCCAGWGSCPGSARRSRRSSWPCSGKQYGVTPPGWREAAGDVRRGGLAPLGRRHHRARDAGRGRAGSSRSRSRRRRRPKQ